MDTNHGLRATYFTAALTLCTSLLSAIPSNGSNVMLTGPQYPIVVILGGVEFPESTPHTDTRLWSSLFPRTRVEVIHLPYSSSSLSSQFASIAPLIQEKAAIAMNETGAEGFTLLGFSTGAVIGRAYVERINDPPVKIYVSVAGPHTGISTLPLGYLLGFSPRVSKLSSQLLQHLVQSDLGLVDSYLGSVLTPPVTRPRLVGDGEEDSASSDSPLFMEDINNNRLPRKDHYRRNIAQLEKMELVRLQWEQLLDPPSSAVFGGVVEGQDTPMRLTPLYLEDHIGLMELDSKGQLCDSLVWNGTRHESNSFREFVRGHKELMMRLVSSPSCAVSNLHA